MRDPREDVLNKMDALLKKHHATEPDIPVLTDIVEHPRVDLEAIPILTEEVDLVAEAYPAPFLAPVETSPAQATPVEEQVQIPMQAEPLPDIALDLVHPSVADAPPSANANSVLQRLEAVEAEMQAEIDARIGKTQSTPSQRASIEVPPDARFILLASAIPADNVPLETPSAPTLPPQATSSAPMQLPEDLVKQVAAMIETDVGRIIKKQLHQSLDEELAGMLNQALDKALSSMLEQFMVHLEEVVRISIADELKKQLAPFKRPAPTHKP